MKRIYHFGNNAAFTLVEALTGTVIASLVGLAIFSLTNTATLMAARNFSLNLTNNHERRSLDRIEQVIQQAYTMPTLIDTTGAATTSPAAGTTFDYFVGSPYVVTASGSSLPLTTNSLTLTRSTNSVASPPIPVYDDVVMLNGAPSTVRALVSSAVAGTPDGSQHQSITVNLASTLGSAVPVPSSSVLTSTLVHKVAFIVMPAANGGRELRYYFNYETTTNLNDPRYYIILSDEVALQTTDATPFSLSTVQTASFVNLSLRVRSNQFDTRLLGKQGDQFNTFARLDVAIRPKTNPQ